jgi:HSF-type DNA-binding
MCVSKPRICANQPSHPTLTIDNATTSGSLTTALRQWRSLVVAEDELSVSKDCGSALGEVSGSTKLQGAEDIPVKTATNRDRHYVHHDYHDHAQDSTNGHWLAIDDMTAVFPIKLHSILGHVGNNGMDHIISWASHGRCFKIHKPKEFLVEIANKYVISVGYFCQNTPLLDSTITLVLMLCRSLCFSGTFISPKSRRFSVSSISMALVA